MQLTFRFEDDQILGTAGEQLNQKFLDLLPYYTKILERGEAYIVVIFFCDNG